MAELRQTLLQVGMSEIASARNHGADALQMSDLILTDIAMSGAVHGTHRIKELRKRALRFKATFMSGDPAEASIHGKGLCDADITLMKPVGPQDVLQALAQTPDGGGDLFNLSTGQV